MDPLKPLMIPALPTLPANRPAVGTPFGPAFGTLYRLRYQGKALPRPLQADELGTVASRIYHQEDTSLCHDGFGMPAVQTQAGENYYIATFKDALDYYRLIFGLWEHTGTHRLMAQLNRQPHAQLIENTVLHQLARLIVSAPNAIKTEVGQTLVRQKAGDIVDFELYVPD